MASADNIPTLAIQTFERQTQLRICIHDRCGRFRSYLDPAYLWHSGPLCAMAKRGAYAYRCAAWESKAFDASLASAPEGIVHVCHAGFVEWAVPGIEDGQLRFVLYAGQRRAARDLRPARVDRPSGLNTRGSPPQVEASEGADLHEALRQLASRLLLWLCDASEVQAPATRAARIRHFVRRRHSEAITLDDLGRELGLSASRAMRVARETTGQSWRELLVAARLRTACDLLSHTDLTVSEIAQTCGFGDQSTLQRNFAKRLGCAPGQYRKDPEAQLSAKRPR